MWGSWSLSVKDPLPTSATLSASGVSGPHSEAALNRCLNMTLHCTLFSFLQGPHYFVPTQLPDGRPQNHCPLVECPELVQSGTASICHHHGNNGGFFFLTYSARPACSSFMTLSSLSPVSRWRKVILEVGGQLCSPLLRVCRLPDPYSHWGRVSGHCFSHILSFQFSPYTGGSQVSLALCSRGCILVCLPYNLRRGVGINRGGTHLPSDTQSVCGDGPVPESWGPPLCL